MIREDSSKEVIKFKQHEYLRRMKLLKNRKYEIYTQNPFLGEPLTKDEINKDEHKINKKIEQLINFHIDCKLSQTPQKYFNYFDKILFDWSTARYMLLDDYLTGVKVLSKNGSIIIDLLVYDSQRQTIQLNANPIQDLDRLILNTNPVWMLSAPEINIMVGKKSYYLFSANYYKTKEENKLEINKFSQWLYQNGNESQLQNLIPDQYAKFIRQIRHVFKKYINHSTSEALKNYLEQNGCPSIKIDILSKTDFEQKNIKKLYREIFPDRQMEKLDGLVGHDKWMKITKID
ncbi:MAG: hypothetical protein LBI41_00940 [Lactobacillales bacterium]|jgi:hypothetical protein|nr:hypothetical protein [Lactobacillales bacterium]